MKGTCSDQHGLDRTGVERFWELWTGWSRRGAWEAGGQDWPWSQRRTGNATNSQWEWGAIQGISIPLTSLPQGTVLPRKILSLCGGVCPSAVTSAMSAWPLRSMVLLTSPLLRYTEEVRNPHWAPGQEPSKFLLMVLSFSPVRRAGPGETRMDKEEQGNNF
jgi:hypothetical protein